ncbi:uncharacterized protein SCHCODRAFT_02324195 [Schizophyllum commune H4-8]|uniref:uncharacterized protein n=1 Tax=Schizophyllum commune (strain H4-8 / FGSC 9210) TaxID=578458 RepID=UPI002160B8FE|nr:uncharacterized protein SCHCODRAFT_02324195 [Schizophyllum commune H4-8]KAI5891617.1 hypothetical protein SCHCODRAFT_02324195 [Schizophyllum commune H4-8]
MSHQATQTSTEDRAQDAANTLAEGRASSEARRAEDTSPATAGPSRQPQGMHATGSRESLAPHAQESSPPSAHDPSSSSAPRVGSSSPDRGPAPRAGPSSPSAGSSSPPAPPATTASHGPGTTTTSHGHLESPSTPHSHLSRYPSEAPLMQRVSFAESTNRPLPPRPDEIEGELYGVPTFRRVSGRSMLCPVCTCH